MIVSEIRVTVFENTNHKAKKISNFRNEIFYIDSTKNNYFAVSPVRCLRFLNTFSGVLRLDFKILSRAG